jgi:hypothetical protein
MVLAAAGLVSLGTGYRASQAVLDQASAYLPKGETVTHVNAETGGPDATLARRLAEGRPHRQQLETVELPNGRVYAVNRDTGVVSRVDTSRMDTAPVPMPGGMKKKDMELVSGGPDVYAVNRHDGTLPGSTRPPTGPPAWSSRPTVSARSPSTRTAPPGYAPAARSSRSTGPYRRTASW